MLKGLVWWLEGGKGDQILLWARSGGNKLYDIKRIVGLSPHVLKAEGVSDERHK